MRVRLPTSLIDGMTFPQHLIEALGSCALVPIVNCVRLVVGCHSRWQKSWVHSASWDCCTLHSTVH